MLKRSQNQKLKGKNKGKYMLKKLNKNNYYGYDDNNIWLLYFSIILLFIAIGILYFN